MRPEHSGGRLWATSDLHVSHSDNRKHLDSIRPQSDEDWLIVAGDVAEQVADVVEVLSTLRDRFHTVIWVPGNHELWTTSRDDVQLRGVERYEHLVRRCQDVGVLTPEDPFPVWHGVGGPAVIAPLFVLYDYTFRPAGAATKEEALAMAHESGVVCTDEFMLHPDPHPTRDAWCRERIALTEARLAAIDPELPTVLVNHYPLVREPTDVLYYPVFAQWCGSELTADWHTRFRAKTVVYGHLHIPRTTHHDGVRFEEVSVGYPREQRWHGLPFGLMRQILPEPERAS